MRGLGLERAAPQAQARRRARALSPPPPPVTHTHPNFLLFQDQGNAALKTGMQQRKKFYLRQAIEQYTQGLDLMCADDRLVCALYANRAHVNLLLGNYRRALEDARAALKKDPTFTKAGFAVARDGGC